MIITDVRIRKIEDANRLKAVAEITIDDAFVVHEIRIIEGQNGLFVAMPSKQVGENQYKDIAHPINVETRKMLEEAILKAYNEAE